MSISATLSQTSTSSVIGDAPMPGQAVDFVFADKLINCTKASVSSDKKLAISTRELVSMLVANGFVIDEKTTVDTNTLMGCMALYSNGNASLLGLAGRLETMRANSVSRQVRDEVKANDKALLAKLTASFNQLVRYDVKALTADSRKATSEQNRAAAKAKVADQVLILAAVRSDASTPEGSAYASFVSIWDNAKASMTEEAFASFVIAVRQHTF